MPKPPRTNTSFTRILIGLIILLSLAASFFAYQYLSMKKDDSKPYFLFTMKSQSGTLKQSVSGEWKLTLQNPDNDTVYFSDRPYRIAGSVSSRKFINDWSKLGFNKNPPNAALSLDPQLNKGNRQDTIIVTLNNPEVNLLTQTITFNIAQSDNPTGGLESFKKRLDTSVPEKFIEPTLFIDISDQITTLEEAESFNSYVQQA